jgi:hypothetical protein
MTIPPYPSAGNKATPVGATFVRPGPPRLGEMEMIASANPTKRGCLRSSALSQINRGVRVRINVFKVPATHLQQGASRIEPPYSGEHVLLCLWERQ